MNASRRPRTPRVLPWMLATLSLSAWPAAAASGFFDDLPRRGYVIEEYSYSVNRAGEGVLREPVATIRFLRLALDPGTRGVAEDLWPEREMLLVEYVSGERVAFERIVRPPQPRSPGDPRPRGRVGLEGTAVEVFVKGEGAVSGPGRPQACSGMFSILSAGGRDLPVAPDEVGALTVRDGIGRFVESALGERERELVTRTAQIALRAGQARALPVASLDVLHTVFPGRRLDPWPEALVFEAPQGLVLDPTAGGWRSVTDAP
ncbi:MAG TPA: hypothetical protein VE129_04065, partial [Thermoanaerobaculia bacterium]|nr:hypothetical protein [Thermoanaerobaculia bacterium]